MCLRSFLFFLFLRLAVFFSPTTNKRRLISPTLHPRFPNVHENRIVGRHQFDLSYREVINNILRLVFPTEEMVDRRESGCLHRFKPNNSHPLFIPCTTNFTLQNLRVVRADASGSSSFLYHPNGCACSGHRWKYPIYMQIPYLSRECG